MTKEAEKITNFTSTVRRSARLGTPQKRPASSPPTRRTANESLDDNSPSAAPSPIRQFKGGLVTAHDVEDDIPASPTATKRSLAKLDEIRFTTKEAQLTESVFEETKQVKEPKKIDALDKQPIDLRSAATEEKILATPLKSESLPAYLRYAHLATTAPSPIVLPLPSHYELALSTFSALDSVCMLLDARSQRFLFHKSAEAVERITKRSFPARLLGQILGLWPEAYAVEPVTIIKDGRRCKTLSLSFPSSNSISPIELESRRQHFRSLLVKLVQDAHSAFLESQNIFLPRGKKVMNWHPKFDLEGVQELLEKPLFEQTPVAKSESAVSARVQDAFDVLYQSHLNSAISNNETITTDSPVKTPNDDSIKKPKISLLDRVKAKETQAAMEKMTGSNSDRAKQLALLSALSDEFIDLVQMTFTSSKKTTLPRAYLEERLLASSKSASTGALLKQKFDLADRALPSWLTYTSNSEGQHFVRIDKSKSTKDLKLAIEDFKKTL